MFLLSMKLMRLAFATSLCTSLFLGACGPTVAIGDGSGGGSTAASGNGEGVSAEADDSPGTTPLPTSGAQTSVGDDMGGDITDDDADDDDATSGD
ncbi:MAG: hypothetical protein JKY37_13565, partial [Nannocystaceae bacterium]|nr:hypothetical protein [Nannocystaceae bacterium]